MGGAAMISTGDLSQLAILLNILGYTPGGGGGGGVTPRQVQEFAFNYEPATGSNDAFVVNLTPTVTVLTDGLIIAMSSGTLENDTTTPTLQVNALTPVPIVLWAGQLAPGDIEPGGSYLFIYNEDQNAFQLINPSLTTANAFLVQGNSYNNAIDFGAVNAYEVSLLINPASSFGVGFPIYMQVAPGNDNTGASTLTVNGVTDPIVLNNGSPIPAGVLIGNQLAYLLYNGTSWVLMNPATTGTGFVQSVSGASANQVIVDNTDPENPILSLSATLDLPGTFTIQGSTVIDEIIDDDTFSTASDTNIPTSESVKAYVDANSSRLPWTDVTGTSQACAVNNGYISSNVAQTTFSLPATALVGSIIAVQGYGAAGWIVEASAGQIISGGDISSTSGGSVTSQSGNDNIYLLCVVADTEWRVISSYSQGLNYL